MDIFSEVCEEKDGESLQRPFVCWDFLHQIAV